MRIGLHCGFVCGKVSLFLRLFGHFLLFFCYERTKTFEREEGEFVKNRASGIGHRASGIGHRASGIGNKFALLAALLVSALSSLFIPLEQAQAQLLLTINPLQSDTNNTTLWTFSGSTIPELSSSIATQSNNSNHSASQAALFPFAATSGYLFNPSGTQFLTASAPARYNTATNYSLTANTYSLPQITTSSGTRTISHIRLQNNHPTDTLGIRVAGTTSLSYTNGVSVSWSGQGTLPYPIGDFSLTAANEYFYGAPAFAAGYVNGGIGTPTSFDLRVVVSSAPASLIVPEPEEYALIFGLFALGFVFSRRYWQKKQRQQATTS